ncbi:MAG: BrnA antitoxin family protein [Candidatus Aminicenantaceae bacterium]
MKKEYDLKKMKSRKNPYANRLKKQITIRLDNNTIEYFKELSRETGFSYQTLINLYLKDCAENRKKLRVQWIEPSF